MSEYEPKVGDRVRITYEGVVTERTGCRFYLDPAALPHFTDNPAVSIEKVRPPIPKTPGSVARNGNGYFFLLGTGGWISELGNHFTAQSDWDVVFDAGAV